MACDIGLEREFNSLFILRDDIKSCKKISILNSFKIKGREGVRPGCQVEDSEFLIKIHLMWKFGFKIAGGGRGVKLY